MDWGWGEVQGIDLMGGGGGGEKVIMVQLFKLVLWTIRHFNTSVSVLLFSHNCRIPS